MNHMPKAHYIRQLLEVAAYSGSMPSRSQLDKLDKFDLPDGQSLARYRTGVNGAAQRIVSARERAGYGEAFRTAGDECARLAGQMTPTQLEPAEDPEPESYQDITARMFGR